MRRSRGWSSPAWGAVASGLVAAACVPPVGPAPAPRWETPAVIGRPADYARGSRLLLEKRARGRCLLALPGGRGVRTVWDDPIEAWDVDAWTGHVTPAALVPERYAIGCPRLSPDGKELVMTLERGGRRYVYWSPEPEGDRRVRVMEGTSPVWLADGAEWLFTADGRRAALLSRANRVRLLPAIEGGAGRRVAEFASSSDGDRFAVLYTTGAAGELELYAARSLRAVARLRLPGRAEGLTFDGARRGFAFALDGAWVEMEPGEPPTLARRGAAPGGRILRGARVGGGLVVLIDRGDAREIRFVEGR